MATSETENQIESSSNIKITDINIDCLEKICKYLSFEDLLNVADANKQLKMAADLVYNLKYVNKRTHIQSLRKYPHVWPSSTNKKNIFICALKTAFQTLRCFGHLTSKLHICPLNKITNAGEVENFRTNFKNLMVYAGEYCSDCLNEIEIIVKFNGALDHLEKPFLNVKKVYLWGFGPATSLLNKLFPKMEYLKISYNRCVIQNGQCTATDFGNIEKYFPYLDQMDIVTNYGPHRYLLSTHSARYEVFDEVVLKNSKSFGNYRKELPDLKLAFHHLEDICLNMHFDDDENFYSFFRKYPSISKLTLTLMPHQRHKISEKDVNMLKLANALPSLKQIDFHCCKFTPTGAIEWMNQFKSLEKFDFYVELHSDFIDLITKQGNYWQGLISADDGKYACEFVRKC